LLPIGLVNLLINHSLEASVSAFTFGGYDLKRERHYAIEIPLKQVSITPKETVQAARLLVQGLSVTFDHMRRRPITVQYPRLIPQEYFRG